MASRRVKAIFIRFSRLDNLKAGSTWWTLACSRSLIDSYLNESKAFGH